MNWEIKENAIHESWYRSNNTLEYTLYQLLLDLQLNILNDRCPEGLTGLNQAQNTLDLSIWSIPTHDLAYIGSDHLPSILKMGRRKVLFPTQTITNNIKKLPNKYWEHDKEHTNGNKFLHRVTKDYKYIRTKLSKWQNRKIY